MARKKTTSTHSKTDFSIIAATIQENLLEKEIAESFLPYAHLVIKYRALPDARDGLKPVQRRVLWTMEKHGFSSTKPHKKSASMDGACIAEYHPHGEVAVYQAAARLTRSYVFPVPLIDGQGNFGTAPGDSEASHRYTEMRLTGTAEEFLRDIKNDSVAMVPNFDLSKTEPTVLPVTFPNLLVNGCFTGIAVGFACKFAPHNPGEVIDATIATIKNPNITLDELLEIIPGPDFPTGGEIIGVDGIKTAYGTTQENKDDDDRKDGKCRIRSRYRIHELPRGRHQIDFYETPYEVPQKDIVEDLQKYARGWYTNKSGKRIEVNKVEGITNVRNLSDRHHPTSICVDVKSGIDPDKVAQQLLAVSKNLTTTFAFNHVALLEGKPVVLSLKQMIEVFINFRREVVTNRINYQINQLQDEMELLEGLKICLLDIDEVIKVIRNSDGEKEAISKLMKTFKLTQRQADYVAAMRLRQLTKSDRIEINKKIDKMLEELENLRKMLKEIDKEIIKELQQVKKQINVPRRSVILPLTLAEEKASITETKKAHESGESSHLAVENEPCKIVLSDKGLIWRINNTRKVTANSKTGLLVSAYTTNTHDDVLLVLSSGRSVRLQAMMLPTSPSKPDGTLTLKTGEKVVGLIPLTKDEATGKFTTIIGCVTQNGDCKTMDTSTLTKAEECPVMGVADGVKIIAAKLCTDNTRFIFIADNANLLTFDTSTVRPQGRTGGGVVGIKLVKDSKLIYGDIVDKEQLNRLITATDMTLKMSEYRDYPTKGRGAQGLRCHRFLKGEDKLSSAYCGISATFWGEISNPTMPEDFAKRDASGFRYDVKETGALISGNESM